MVTVVGKTAEGLGVYRGLSTDLPLVPAPKNGSRFFAMDNGKTYWYDASSDTWEGYSGGGGGGGGTDDYEDLNNLPKINSVELKGNKTLAALGIQPADTVVTGTLEAGETSITLSSEAITASSTIDIYTGTYGVDPTDVTVATGSITMTFTAQLADLPVKVVIK